VSNYSIDLSLANTHFTKYFENTLNNQHKNDNANGENKTGLMKINHKHLYLNLNLFIMPLNNFYEILCEVIFFFYSQLLSCYKTFAAKPKIQRDNIVRFFSFFSKGA